MAGQFMEQSGKINGFSQDCMYCLYIVLKQGKETRNKRQQKTTYILYNNK